MKEIVVILAFVNQIFVYLEQKLWINLDTFHYTYML
jgi:hypothetical protein